MNRRSPRILFILACALAGAALGVGVGLGIAGLTHKTGMLVMSVGSLLCLAIFALAVTFLLFYGVYSHKRVLNDKTLAPYFARPTAVKDAQALSGMARAQRHAKVMVLSYYDPRLPEKGGLVYAARIHSEIESFFKGRNLYFAAPNRFVFFVLPQEEEGYVELFALLSKKIKKHDPSLRLLIGVSEREIGKDFASVYEEAVAATFDRVLIRENLSLVRYEEIEKEYAALAGLKPNEERFVGQDGDTLRLFPYGYGHGMVDLDFLSPLHLTEEYENASLAKAKEELKAGQEKVGIFFAAPSFHASSFYIALNGVADKKRLIVFLPGDGNPRELTYVAKKIRRMGCQLGYYGVGNSTPLGNLDLEGSYLYLRPDFEADEASVVKAKRRIFAAKNTKCLGGNPADTYHKQEGGDAL